MCRLPRGRETYTCGGVAQRGPSAGVVQSTAATDLASTISGSQALMMVPPSCINVSMYVTQMEVCVT